MDFDLTEEQRLLQDSLARLLADRYGFEQRKEYMKSPEGWSREMWSSYAELGLLGLPFSEEEGGFGGGPVETMLVAEQMGAPSRSSPGCRPWCSAAASCATAATRRLRSELAPKMVAGELLVAFAHTERQSRYDCTTSRATARRDGSPGSSTAARAMWCMATAPTG
jgi:alkylation response protein AidB-like acyl-CoA dehydrogenase